MLNIPMDSHGLGAPGRRPGPARGAGADVRPLPRVGAAAALRGQPPGSWESVVVLVHRCARIT